MQINRTIAIGDIHGCLSKFKELVEKEIQLKKSDHLVLLGDYIDRGSESKQVINYIMGFIENGFRITPLKGNHEDLLIKAYQNSEALPFWIQNGGQKTLDSFQISNIQDLPKKYLAFFLSLKSYYSYQQFLFVHAGFNNNIQNPFADEYSMLWHCQKKYTHPLLIDRTIIHAHCPITQDDCRSMIKRHPSAINIDTGCVYDEKKGYGTLTAYDCTTNSLYFV